MVRVRERVAAVLARRGREVGVDVEEGGSWNVGFFVRPSAGAWPAEDEAAVDDRDAGVTYVRSEPRRLYEGTTTGNQGV
jgi:hypothetical protein